MSKAGFTIVLLSVFVIGVMIAVAASAQMDWKGKIAVSLLITAAAFGGMIRLIFPGAGVPAW